MDWNRLASHRNDLLGQPGTGEEWKTLVDVAGSPRSGVVGSVAVKMPEQAL